MAALSDSETGAEVVSGAGAANILHFQELRATKGILVHLQIHPLTLTLTQEKNGRSWSLF